MLGYFGTLIGHKVAAVGMIAAAAHSAVWLGASNPQRTWIQAGLEGPHPYAYVETGRYGHQRSIRLWKVSAGHIAHIRLLQRGARWRVVIDSYRSIWFRVRRATTITTFETSGPSAAWINGKIVRAR